MAALVLGLLISSAKNSFDTTGGDIVRNAAGVINLDRVLAEYGPETQELRALLKRNYTASVEILASGDPSVLARLGSAEAVSRAEDFRRKLRELAPRNDEQREVKVRALQAADEVFTGRWLALLRAHGSIPITLLIALVAWLCIIFGTFGLLSPLNGTTVVALAMCALSTAGAIFLIEEMNAPLEGTVKGRDSQGVDCADARCDLPPRSVARSAALRDRPSGGRKAVSCNRDCSQSGSSSSRRGPEPRLYRSPSSLHRPGWSESSAHHSGSSLRSTLYRSFGYSRRPFGRCRTPFHRGHSSRILQRTRSRRALRMPVSPKSS
jgi:hypothetical protein